MQTKDLASGEVEETLKDIILTIDMNNPSYEFED